MARSAPILVAEDSALFGQVLSLLVQKILPDARITLTENGALALAAHLADAADLIITDNQMPGLTGTELIRWLRTHQDQTPVVLCSHDDLANATLAAGASRFVAKANILSDLPTAIDALLPPGTEMSAELC